jgi:hypothetical protein
MARQQGERREQHIHADLDRGLEKRREHDPVGSALRSEAIESRSSLLKARRV